MGVSPLTVRMKRDPDTQKKTLVTKEREKKRQANMDPASIRTFCLHTPAFFSIISLRSGSGAKEERCRKKREE